MPRRCRSGSWSAARRPPGGSGRSRWGGAGVDRAAAGGGVDVHMSSFAIILLSSLASGSTGVIPRMGRGGVDHVDGGELADLIEARGINVVSGSPAFLAPIFAAVERRGRPLRG